MHHSTGTLPFSWPYSISFLGSKVEEVRNMILCSLCCCLYFSGLSALHLMLGSNLQTRGCVSCVGAVAQSICLHQWAEAVVCLGQQDPAKHQLLAAFYTDSHQEGHIYSTASFPVRLEDLSAPNGWIFVLSWGFVLFTHYSLFFGIFLLRRLLYMCFFFVFFYHFVMLSKPHMWINN